MTDMAKIDQNSKKWVQIDANAGLFHIIESIRPLTETNTIIHTIRIYILQSNNHIFIAAILSKMRKNPVKIGVNYLSRPNEVEVII